MPTKANPLLASVGIVMIIGAVAMALFGRGTTSVSIFAVLGVFLLLAGVFERRMEGQQKVGLTGASINLSKLNRSTARADRELAEGKTKNLEDLSL